MLSLEAKVGSFVVAGFVLLGVAIFLLGDYTFEKRYTLYVTFKDVASLTKDSPVKLSGVEIGKVHDIVLADSRAKVVARIRKGVDVYRDAEFSIGSTGIIGSKFLQIDQGRPESGVVAPETTINGTDPVSIEKALTKALASLQIIMDDLNKPGPRGTLTQNMRDTVANLREATASLNDLMETSRPSLTSALDRMDGITRKLDDLLAKSNAMMASLATDKGTVGALLHDEKIKNDVKETVASVRDTFTRLNQFRVYWNYDWRYEHAIRTSRVDLGLKIVPREGRYYYVGGANLANVSDDPASGRHVDYQQKNRVDALLGFVRGPFDFGVGVLRSGGGGRVTVTPFWKHPEGKRFSLSVQAYDFGRNRIVEGRRMDHPNVDVGVMARLHRLIGIGARVEDLQEVPRYQTWVNVAFEDKDIAYLFGIASFGAAGTRGRSKKD